MSYQLVSHGYHVLQVSFYTYQLKERYIASDRTFEAWRGAKADETDNLGEGG